MKPKEDFRALTQQLERERAAYELVRVDSPSEAQIVSWVERHWLQSGPNTLALGHGGRTRLTISSGPPTEHKPDFQTWRSAHVDSNKAAVWLQNHRLHYVPNERSKVGAELIIKLLQMVRHAITQEIR